MSGYFALDNCCPHLGFPLARGSIEDGILTCHSHHARFELAGCCTFNLWADDVPNGIDPEAYFRDVLARIADYPINRIADLLPGIGGYE